MVSEQRAEAAAASPFPPDTTPYDEPVSTREWHGLAVCDTIVSGLPGGVGADATSQERYAAWISAVPSPEIEFLLPRLVRDTTPEWPPYLVPTAAAEQRSADDIAATVATLAPWSVGYRFAHGIDTDDQSTLPGQVRTEELMFRRQLINGTVAALLGDELPASTVVDMGCNAGFFSLDMAGRGARHVDGVDLRPENIAQARFAAEHYGMTNATFHASDIDAFPSTQQWDVVLNLGLLYHVTNPIELVQRTYDVCRRFAVIDTVVHREPVSAYILFANKDVASRTEGRSAWEFHPTYRAVIDTMRHAGFRDVFEVVSATRPRHHLYRRGQRRCFLGVR